MIRAALATPLTGPLARYGTAGAVALQMWAEWHNRHHHEPVEFWFGDAHPDPVDAIRRAEKADIIFGPYGSSVARAVLGATNRTVFNHGGAAVEGFANQVPLLGAATTYFQGPVQVIRAAGPELRTMAVVSGDSGFSTAVSRGAVEVARRHRFDVVRLPLDGDPGDAEVLVTVGAFAEELALARRLLPGGWRAVAMVGAGVDEVLAPLGDLREGLIGPAQWMATAAPDPTLGPTAAEFVALYRAQTGTEPPYPAAQAFAAGLIAGRCLQLAGSTDDAALLAAARTLDCVTLLGRFRLDADTGRQVGHQILTVQWQEGRRQVVWPPELAETDIRLLLA